jgi:hypothetical protein
VRIEILGSVASMAMYMQNKDRETSIGLLQDGRHES